MSRQWLNHDFWPETTGETNCSNFLDPILFADVVAPRTQPAGDDGPETFLTRKCREMQIVVACSVSGQSLPEKLRREQPGSWVTTGTSDMGASSGNKH